VTFTSKLLLLYDLHFKTASSLMDLLRGCETILKIIPTQSPLKTPGGVNRGSSEYQVSTRYFYVAK